MIELAVLKSEVFKLLAANQFLTGGALLGFLGAGLAYARFLPVYAWELFQRYFLHTITVESSDPIFHGFSERVQEVRAACHNSKAKTIREMLYDHQEDKTEITYSAKFDPINDARFVKIAGVWCWFWSYRTKSENGDRQGVDLGNGAELSLSPDLFLDSYAITVFGRKNAEKIKKYIKEDCTAILNERKEKTIKVFTLSGWSWRNVKNPEQRAMDTINLPEGMADEIVKDADKFFKSKSWYLDKGIPHRRGYLFYGQPGNGKSSFVTALSSKLGLNLYMTSLRQISNDSALISALSSVDDRSIILIEDVDALVKSRESHSDGGQKVGLSFAGLLNAIDGVAAQTGSLLIMTTNYPERLDPALVRPGRIDKKIEFKNANNHQCRSMYLRFFPGQTLLADEFAKRNGGEKFPTCAIQEHLLRWREDAGEAIVNSIDYDFKLAEEIRSIVPEDDAEDIHEE